jgi:hypothetical protein
MTLANAFQPTSTYWNASQLAIIGEFNPVKTHDGEVPRAIQPGLARRFHETDRHLVAGTYNSRRSVREL